LSEGDRAEVDGAIDAICVDPAVDCATSLLSAA
jgi:hypothetical protein